MPELPELIKTKRALLRRISVDDAAGWKSFNNAIAKRTQWPIVPSIVYARNELLNYMEMWSKERYVYIVLDKDGKVIGDFHFKSIDRKRHRMEFGHALHPAVWGTGVTYELLDAMKKAAQNAGFTLWCKVDPANIRSWKSLEKYKAIFIGRRSFKDDMNKPMKVYEL